MLQQDQRCARAQPGVQRPSSVRNQNQYSAATREFKPTFAKGAIAFRSFSAFYLRRNAQEDSLSYDGFPSA